MNQVTLYVSHTAHAFPSFLHINLIRCFSPPHVHRRPRPLRGPRRRPDRPLARRALPFPLLADTEASPVRRKSSSPLLPSSSSIVTLRGPASPLAGRRMRMRRLSALRKFDGLGLGLSCRRLLDSGAADAPGYLTLEEESALTGDAERSRRREDVECSFPSSCRLRFRLRSLSRECRLDDLPLERDLDLDLDRRW